MGLGLAEWWSMCGRGVATRPVVLRTCLNLPRLIVLVFYLPTCLPFETRDASLLGAWPLPNQHKAKTKPKKIIQGRSCPLEPLHVFPMALGLKDTSPCSSGIPSDSGTSLFVRRQIDKLPRLAAHSPLPPPTTFPPRTRVIGTGSPLFLLVCDFSPVFPAPLFQPSHLLCHFCFPSSLLFFFLFYSCLSLLSSFLSPPFSCHTPGLFLASSSAQQNTAFTQLVPPKSEPLSD